jgi:hypothetical protein
MSDSDQKNDPAENLSGRGETILAARIITTPVFTSPPAE